MNFVIDFVAYTFRCKNYQCSKMRLSYAKWKIAFTFS